MKKKIAMGLLFTGVSVFVIPRAVWLRMKGTYPSLGEALGQETIHVSDFMEAVSAGIRMYQQEMEEIDRFGNNGEEGES